MSSRRVPTVAFVTDAIFPYHQGGKEVRYHELTRRLASRASVHVYTMRWWDGPRVRREDGVTYHAISPLLPLYSGRRRSIRQAIVFALACLRLLFRRFDLIEADHMPYIQLFPLRLVATLRRRRLFVTWHEVWGPAYWRSYLGLAGQLGWWLERLAMRLPDAIIAASPQTAQRLRERVPPEIPLVVAPNGVDLGDIRAAGAAPQQCDVVTVCRLIEHKRVDLLLDAVADLREHGLRVTCRIVGDGPERDALRRQAQALGIESQIDFRHDVTDRERLYELLKSASVFVCPSEREGFGIAVLEALAAGLPVVTTSAPNNLARHLVARSGDGVVCEPSVASLADAIQRLLGRRDGAARADEGWIDEFGWEAITERVAGAMLR